MTEDNSKEEIIQIGKDLSDMMKDWVSEKDDGWQLIDQEKNLKVYKYIN